MNVVLIQAEVIGMGMADFVGTKRDSHATIAMGFPRQLALALIDTLLEPQVTAAQCFVATAPKDARTSTIVAQIIAITPQPVPLPIEIVQASQQVTDAPYAYVIGGHATARKETIDQLHRMRSLQGSCLLAVGLMDGSTPTPGEPGEMRWYQEISETLSIPEMQDRVRSLLGIAPPGFS